MAWASSLNDSGRGALILNIAAATGGALALNAMIFAAGWARAGDGGLAAPLIAAVWVGLFAGLGLARWRLIRAASEGWQQDARRGPLAWQARRRVDLLLLNCALFPFYTLGLSHQALGLAGTALTLALAVHALLGAWRASRTAALLVLPVVLWAGLVLGLALWVALA